MTVNTQNALYQDSKALNSIKEQYKTDPNQALEMVAKEFEAQFMDMLMQSMRQANESFESDAFSKSNTTKLYEQMLDQQLSKTLSQNGSLGLYQLIVKQLQFQGGEQN